MTFHVTGAGVEYDPKQWATAEFIDNMSIHYCIASMLNIQSRDKILKILLAFLFVPGMMLAN